MDIACTFSFILSLSSLPPFVFLRKTSNHFLTIQHFTTRTLNGYWTHICTHEQTYMGVRKSCTTLLSFLWEDKKEGFVISSFCVVLAIKKHPVLWLWKKPVFNSWETHKSLSLLSYRLQNWKQMLHSPLLSFELANYGVVKIKISL